MKTKLTKILSCVFGFAAVLCFSMAMFSGEKDKAPVSASEIVSADIAEEYYIGDIFDLPDTVSIKINEEETIAGSNGILIFPDRTVHNDKTYLFDITGKYEAVYYGVYQGETIRASKAFRVLDEKYIITSSRSSVEYSDGLSLSKNQAVPGIDIELADGDAFVFDVPVNINDMGDAIDVITFIADVQPAGAEKVTASTISIKMVDRYNPDIFIEWYWWKQNVSGSGYVGGGANNQQLFGLETGSYVSNPNMTTSTGIKGNKHYSNRYALSNVYGKASRSSTKNFTDSPLTFSYCPSENVLYNGGNWRSSYITDVDDPIIYPKGNYFEGFTTGEVYVQVQCFNYNFNSIRLQITSLFGLTGEQLKNGYVVDTIDPIIELDKEYTDDTGLYITKGREFTLPVPTVYDVNYKGDINVSLYYNYDTNNPLSINVVDNKFVPEFFGKYTAVYTAKDVYGNTTVREFVFNSVSEKAFTYEQIKLEKLVAAAENVIPAVVPTNINKAYTTVVEVTDPFGNTTDVTKSMLYRPEALGEYTITYKFTDNAYTEVYSYTVKSQDEGAVWFRDEFKINPYLIKNATYDFDDYYAYVATKEGLKACLADFYISVDGAEFVKLSNPNEYKVTAESSIAFKCTYDGKESEVLNVNVVDLGYGTSSKDYTKFFANNATSTSTSNTAITYKFSNKQPATLQFINPVLASEFQVDFIIPTAAAYDTISFVISEFGNTKVNTFIVSYYRVEKEGSVGYKVENIQGEELYNVAIAGNFEGKHQLLIEANAIINNEGTSVAIAEFSDPRAIFSINIPSATAAFSLDITKISNQNFTGRVKESNEAAPQLYYKRELFDTKLGAVVTMPKAIAVSVFSPVLAKDVKMSISNQQGDIIVGADGFRYENLSTEQDYKLTLSFVGMFKAVYEFSANTGTARKSAKQNIVVTAVDNVAPIVVFDDGINENTLITIKKGTTHVIKPFKVTDNETPADQLFTRVIIYNELEAYVAWNVSEYTFDTPGMYVVTVVCQDSIGNLGKASYTVKVEG